MVVEARSGQVPTSYSDMSYMGCRLLGAVSYIREDLGDLHIPFWLENRMSYQLERKLGRAQKVEQTRMLVTHQLKACDELIEDRPTVVEHSDPSLSVTYLLMIFVMNGLTLSD